MGLVQPLYASECKTPLTCSGGQKFSHDFGHRHRMSLAAWTLRVKFLEQDALALNSHRQGLMEPGEPFRNHADGNRTFLAKGSKLQHGLTCGLLQTVLPSTANRL